MSTVRSVASALAAVALALCSSAGERLDYDYTVSRRDVEKTPGALKDGDLKTQIVWHTRFKEETDIVCELPQPCDLDRIVLQETRHNKFYITKEIRVALDDGSGDFGDPIVLPPLTGPVWTNFTWTVEKPGRAVRVKLTMVTDAYGALTEVALYGKAAADSPTGKRPPLGTEGAKTVENGMWKLAVSPLGGRLAALASKACGFELVDPEAGSFTESCWDRKPSFGFLAGKPFALQDERRSDGSVAVSAVGNFQGGGINFLRVEKRYVAAPDSTALRVEYRFVNIPEAMARQSYGMLLESALGVRGRAVTCFSPSANGIVAIGPGTRPAERWIHHPSRGWMAAATDDGTGYALTLPAADVRNFRGRFGSVPSQEWRMVPVELDCDEVYGVTVEVIPFKGLKTVSGAGGGLVGELAGGTCRVVSARAGRIVAEADGESVALAFAKPGESRSFRTSATSVRLLRDGAEVCRLDAAPKGGAWKMEPLVRSREATVREVDLTCYTNFPSTGVTPWAKPLPGRRLKVAFVTGHGNQLEVGRLAERFDMEYRTAPVMIGVAPVGKRTLNNPVFSFGDHFSQIGPADSERAARTALSWNCDAIVVAGIPFEAFPADLRKLLVEKVSAGAGLVWVGGDCDVPELGLKLAGKPLMRALPAAVGEAFADVPFALLGEEQVYAFAEEGAKVHAACKDRAYLTERPLGKGRVFNLPYRAIADLGSMFISGLTPDLRDFYPDRVAPSEPYCSLLAKTILAAGGKTLPVRLGAAEVSADAAAVRVTSDVAGKVAFVWTVKNAFGETLASGTEKCDLAKGVSTVRMERLGVKPFAGPLEFALTVRTRKGVLAWGGWAFESAPGAAIADVKLDEPYHREGEEVRVEVKIRGKREEGRGKRLRMRVVDSYGRELISAFPSGTTWAFKVENALPARCYDVIAELMDGERVCARRRAELRVRPSREKIAWDDYEAGTWWNAETRDYLWPEIAAEFRKAGISTLIANPWRGQVDFPIRHGFNPTYLSDAGLHRTPEPAAYAKTGDKMTLARPTCLSSPKFFADRDSHLSFELKALPKLGLRLVWFGDEQSITGYGGNPVDFCFSEHCLREFRAFAKAKYGTLEKLNEEYESASRSWDEVLPFTRQEVWGAGEDAGATQGQDRLRHVAGWADHLEFMDSRLTNSLAYNCDRLRLADPDLRFALSGTQMPSAYGGMDWSKILGVLDCALSYGVGGQHDIHRSLCPDGRFMPWDWGYSRRGEEGVADIWRTAFWGSAGVMSFWARSMWNPDLTRTRGLADTAPHVRRLVDGVGRHILENLKTRPEVAVLYSQPSIRAAFIEKRREESDKLQEKVRLLLFHLGISFDYVSGEQLAGGELTRRGFRALLLADAAALSDAEIAAVRAFAAAGGRVIAEGVPATRRANCRQRPAPALADLFGDARHLLVGKVDTAYLEAMKYPDKAENAVLLESEQRRLAAALGRDAAGGLSIVSAADGKLVRNVAVFARSDRAGNPFWGVLAPEGRVRDAVFRFPKRGWVCDLVSGRVFGVVESVNLPLRRGMPFAFVQFAAVPAPVGLSVDGATAEIRNESAADTVVRLRVFRPDGTEAQCYAKNLTLRAGQAVRHVVPFVRSDPKGTWKLELDSVFGDRRTATCVR